MANDLTIRISQCFSELHKVIESFTGIEFNAVPYEGSWTAGEVSEHILLFTSGLPELSSGTSRKTARPRNEKVKEIEKIFLDFNIQMKSPEFIVPKCNFHEKKKLQDAFKKIEGEYNQVKDQNELSTELLDFEVPGMGPFTIYEWLVFGTVHAQRHIHQLKKIRGKLDALK